MGLTILGRSASETELSDNEAVFGVMTQVPNKGMLHSPDGLTNGDGNTAFGIPFSVLAHATHTTTHAAQTTTCTITSDGMPYKIRVLGVKVRCLANRPEDFQDGWGHINAQVEDSDGSGVWTSILAMEGLGDMEAGDVREMAAVNETTAVIDSDEGLRVKITSRADSFGTNPTASFVVELQCLRVI